MMLNQLYRSRFEFGTKAETLRALSAHEGRFEIPPHLFLTVDEWRSNHTAVLARIVANFGFDALVAVRSSAHDEDGAGRSAAGAYDSFLDVPVEPGRLTEAIEAVIASYGPTGCGHDQVLVQTMVRDVALFGVAFTLGIENGAPYYVLEYDDVSGRTDTVTGGTNVHKCVHIHRSAPVDALDSERLKVVLRGLRELEHIIGGVPLDVEFALDSQDRLCILQVRRLTALLVETAETSRKVERALLDSGRLLEGLKSTPSPLAGSDTQLANMSDWNPAEMLGVLPRPLAASLYRALITRDIWARARADMGYAPLPDCELMVLLAGHPYIDVRNSLNSFLPQGLEDGQRNRLVDSSMARLSAAPELHDKLEFEVAVTIFTPSFAADMERIHGSALDTADRASFEAALRALTREVVSTAADSSLVRAETAVAALAERQRQAAATNLAEASAHALLARVKTLVGETRREGTLPFSILARHGFVAEAWLRSLIAVGALTPERAAAFRASIRTVAGELCQALSALASGTLAPADFSEQFGHLRPSTYDLRSKRYDACLEQLAGGRPAEAELTSFALAADEHTAVARSLTETGLEALSPETLFDYFARATRGREYGKHVFTRHLSDMLETLAHWGHHQDLDREDLSFLTLDRILDEMTAAGPDESGRRLAGEVEARRRAWTDCALVKLPALIRGTNDLVIVPQHRAQPTFITAKTVKGAVRYLDARDWDRTLPLAGTIVCIEAADPGYDWVFSHEIAGLVTKYGGSNSHMAIRAAEFGLPAAIGAGEMLFDKVRNAKLVELDCAEGFIGTA